MKAKIFTKKFVITVFCFALIIFSLFLSAACGGNGIDNSTTEPPANITTGDVLVVYFSCTNNTENAANKIAASMGCAAFEIIPGNPYTSEDLNYNDGDCRANREQNDPGARPSIANAIENIENYDTIFIGYPIWWGKLPKIIYTLCDTYDFSEKTIIPFCTSGGSGIVASVNELKELEPNADVLSGRRMSGNVSQSEVDQWLASLNLS